jgi:uncharacterized membrane protein
MFVDNFWRTEVWHPLSVHFPIALLLISTLTMTLSFIVKQEFRNQWKSITTYLLLTGCLTVWISIYTGNLADGIVSRKICDPTVLKDHEIAANTTALLFTSASLLSILYYLRVVNGKLQTIASFTALIIMLIGCGFLIKASHLGATLVYQQGAGVYNHTQDCSEYE